jgi:hypothetical protein
MGGAQIVKLILPQATQWKLIKSIHDTFNLGQDATQGLIGCFGGLE